jgi:pilus assembly protein CpaB
MPGDRVDVLLTMSSDHNDGTGGGTTTTLLQNVEVMAVDQAVEAPAENKVDLKELRSVTLQVAPEQALILSLGQNKGILHLSLRNPEDSRETKTRPATLAELRFRQEKPWDERVKGVIEEFGKAMAKRPIQRTTPTPRPASRPPRIAIRTIRGIQEGAVTIVKESGPDGSR